MLVFATVSPAVNADPPCAADLWIPDPRAVMVPVRIAASALANPHYTQVVVAREPVHWMLVFVAGSACIDPTCSLRVLPRKTEVI